MVAAVADYRHTCGRQRAAAKSRGARDWHALCQAMEITLVVAAAGTARGEVAGGACWHALCQAKEITLVVAAAAGYRYLTGGRGGRLPAYLPRRAAVKTFDANG